jgi:hypothetical protein
MQSGIRRITNAGMLGVCTLRVVALLANLPADRVPDLMQVLQFGLEHGFGVTPDMDFAFADLERSVLRASFANDMAEL